VQADLDPADLRRQLAELLHEQRQLIERLQGGQAYFQQLARSVWRVQEDERRRIANELHDGVGHNLAAVIHLVANARAALGADGAIGTPALDALERAHAIAESTLQDTREMSRLLRPQILDDLGLEAAMHWLARTYSETRNLDVRFDFHPSPQPLDGDRATLVFRVAQEALVNAARHAAATRVELAYDGRGANAVLRVSDDGGGCDLAVALARGSTGASSGLGGMRDRARLFDGNLQFDSAPGRGFTLVLDLPLDDGHARRPA
jgi:signal transduction histidine kinase